MAGPEISRLLTGNTVLGRDRLGPFWMHYPSQGTVWGLASNGDVDIGRWWISGNHYCRAWRRWRGGAEQCWLVASDGSSRLLWIVPDGRSSAESTIEAGNTIGGRSGRKLAAADAIGSDVASGGPTASDETVPVDASGLILVARQPEGARGGEPGGIDSGGVDGGGGAGSGSGSGGAGAGGNGNGAGGNDNGDQDGSGAGGDDGDRDGKGRGHGRGGNNGDGDDGDD